MTCKFHAIVITIPRTLQTTEKPKVSETSAKKQPVSSCSQVEKYFCVNIIKTLLLRETRRWIKVYCEQTKDTTIALFRYVQ